LQFANENGGQSRMTFEQDEFGQIGSRHDNQIIDDLLCLKLRSELKAPIGVELASREASLFRVWSTSLGRREPLDNSFQYE
jgi:hypothetical protein